MVPISQHAKSLTRYDSFNIHPTRWQWEFPRFQTAWEFPRFETAWLKWFLPQETILFQWLVLLRFANKLIVSVVLQIFEQCLQQTTSVNRPPVRPPPERKLGNPTESTPRHPWSIRLRCQLGLLPVLKFQFYSVLEPLQSTVKSWWPVPVCLRLYATSILIPCAYQCQRQESSSSVRNCNRTTGRH